MSSGPAPTWPAGPAGPAAPIELARARTEHGELLLRRRGDVLELVVDGVFAMDTVDVSTERALADLALDRCPPAPPEGFRVVVGGLGLGYTADRLLREARVGHVLVVELHPEVVAWARAGLTPVAGAVLADPRVEVRVGDVADVVPALPPRAADAVLLDVDNGPGFLIHQGNERIYGSTFITAALAALRPGGVLAVWSAQREPGLAARLAALAGDVEEVRLDVRRDGRDLEYALYLLRAPAGG